MKDKQFEKPKPCSDEIPHQCIDISQPEPCTEVIDLDLTVQKDQNLEMFIDPNTCIASQCINLCFPDLPGVIKLDSTAQNDPSEETQHIEIAPTLYLLGVYQTSSFMGKTGSGQLLSDFYLLPGEESTITISTFSKVSTGNIETSSIVDSYSFDTQQAFFKDVRSQETTLEYREETSAASGSAGGGLSGILETVGISVEAEADYGKTIHKEQTNFKDKFTRTLTNHVKKASSSRNIQVGTTTSKETVNIKYESVQRVLKNPNINRTLSYKFKQAIQEYECVLHLIDMKIGYKSKEKGKMIVIDQYPLEKLDELLKERVIDPDKNREKIKERILKKLLFINSAKDKTIDITKSKNNATIRYDFDLEKRCIYDIIKVDEDGKESLRHGPYQENEEIKSDEFIRFREDEADKRTTLKYKADELYSIVPSVPGFIVDITKQRLKTDSVIIEPEVGCKDALDEIGKNLENQKLWSIYLENRKELALLRKEQIAQDILKRYKDAINDKKDESAWKTRYEADIFNKLYFDQRLDPFPEMTRED
ncbi:hypothetical protein ACQCVL_02755 [Bacillus thuringiensis]|uniref:hypothetical protein n=1 Tax=Bacillus thuringiensis TaxID=1428 RepID=UPI003CF61F44